MANDAYDYARVGYYYRQHHIRFVRFVEKRKLVCQACRGRGGATEPVLDDGSGPWEECSWCEGTGYIAPHDRGIWLRCCKEDKAILKRIRDANANV